MRVLAPHIHIYNDELLDGLSQISSSLVVVAAKLVSVCALTDAVKGSNLSLALVCRQAAETDQWLAIREML